MLWNVFAAPPFSLEARQWCYPFAGCTPYRGYFSRDAALRAAQRFADEGLETYVGGVAAYSTLGWFDDPLLSTFIHWPEAELAELLIHETAHRRLWVADDVPLNEAFASFVGEEGARQWFAVQGPVRRVRGASAKAGGVAPADRVADGGENPPRNPVWPNGGRRPSHPPKRS